MMKFFTFFMEGGLAFMSVLTVLLVGIFFAAWKAPRWVKEIGLFALAFGFLGHLLGAFHAAKKMATRRMVRTDMNPMPPSMKNVKNLVIRLMVLRLNFLSQR